MFTKVFRIGNEPAIRFTPGGDAVLNLSLAYSYGRKGDDGKRPTQWVDASLWGKQAEVLQQYLIKGKQIGATLDDVHIEVFQGKNGEGHKLVARIANIELIGGQQSDQTEQKQAARPAQTHQPQGVEDMDDDIPFN